VSGRPTNRRFNSAIIRVPRQGTPLPALRQKIIVVGQLCRLFHGALRRCEHALGRMPIGAIRSVCLIGWNAAVRPFRGPDDMLSRHRRGGRHPSTSSRIAQAPYSQAI